MVRSMQKLVFGAVAMVLLLPAASAQQTPVAGAQTAPAGQGQGAPATTRPAKTPVKDAAAPAASGGSEAALRKRVEQLEEQLVDLQVVIGTLESLAKSPGSGAAGAAPYRAPTSGGASDQARIDGIEMQIRALTQQMEQLSAEVRARPRGEAAALPPSGGTFQPNAAVMPPAPARPAAPGGDAIGGILASEPLPPVESTPGPTAALGPASDDPKVAYEAAYGHMLQQDYGAAQSGFGAFLKSFPQHALVPNALYWLGETYYVQKNYADAAEAFDIVLSSHAASNKAPDSQLKKAMSLSLLGKTADACSALRQLAVKYPNAPSHVKTKADSERRRVGCT